MADRNAELKRHPIQVVAARAGLTAHVLRAWERRYDVVDPARSEGGHRLYSDADIERLRLLRDVTDAGRRIGDVAEMSTAQLAAMATEDRQAVSAVVTPAAGRGTVEKIVDDCVAAATGLDGDGLDEVLERAVVVLRSHEFIDEVVAPLMRRIGEMWYEGRLEPRHEHLASWAVSRALGGMLAALPAPPDAPHLLVATPAGQRHEIGALLAATAAAGSGWQVTYLGANLPAADLIGAVRETRADALALSIVHPDDDSQLASELRSLRDGIATTLPILVGGRAAPAYRKDLDAIGTVTIADGMPELRDALGIVAGSRGLVSSSRTDVQPVS